MNRRLTNTYCLLTALAFVFLGTTQIDAQGVPARPDATRALEQVLEVREAKVQSLRASVRELERAILTARAKLDRASISHSSFPNVMKMLHTQRVQLAVDVAGLEARREAIEAGRQSGDGGDARKLLALLEKAVEVQQSSEERARALFESAAASQAQLQEARQLTLQAEVRLEEARLAYQSSKVERLTGQALDVYLELADKRARLEKVESLLDGYVDLRVSVDDVRQMEARYESEVARLHEQLRALEEDRSKLEFERRAKEDF